MTTYYVSPDGSNANNGLGPDASHATNKPWLTVGKAMNTGSPVLPGDTVHVGPGSFFSEALAPIAAIASVGSPTSIRGDPLNLQGFKTAGGILRPPAVVYVTSRTSAQLDAPDLLGPVLNLINNDPSGLQFYNFILESTASLERAVIIDLNGSTDLLFEDMRLLGGQRAVQGNSTPTAGRNWTFRRCILAGGSSSVELTPGLAAATADADLNINFEHCLHFGRVLLNIGTTAGNKAGGVHLKGATMICPSTPALETSPTGGHSIVTPSTYEGCLIVVASQMASTPDTGALVDGGYNRGCVIQQANTNVTEAGTSKRGVPMHLVLPDLVKWGLALPTDEIFRWTAQAAAAQRASGWTNTQPDFRGRTARPWGGGASIGYMELPEISQETGSQIGGGGANSLKIVGAGELSLFVPVDAVATTITIVTKSTSYGGASYPQLIAEANPEIGVTQQTGTATDATEQTLTLGPFTPTAAGVLEVRLISRSSSPSSSTYFDKLAQS